MKVVVDFDCVRPTRVHGHRARGLRGPRRRLPLRAAGESARGAAQRSRGGRSPLPEAGHHHRGLTSDAGCGRSRSSARPWPASARRSRFARRLRRHASRSIGRGAPSSVRPSAAVEAGPRRHMGARPPAPQPQLARPHGCGRSAPRLCPAAIALDRRCARSSSPTDRRCRSTGSSSPPARRSATSAGQPTSPGCTCCARSTTASRSGPTSTAVPVACRRRRRRIHRRRGRGDGSSSAGSRSRCSRHRPVPMQRVLGDRMGDCVRRPPP